MSKSPQPPRLRRHKPKDRAYVRLNGRQVYLGKWNSPEAKAAYDRILREWRAEQEPEKYALTVADLACRYIDHAEIYYRKNGEPTSEVQLIRDALKRLVDLHRSLRAAELRPRHIKEYQEALVRSSLARTTINSYVAKLRRVLKFGVAEEIVPADVLMAIQAVPPLKKGRTRAKETTPVRPVPDALVDVLEPHVPATVWAMIQVQRYSGLRPGEVRIMRGCDLNTSGAIWEFAPESHKTEHHGKQRVVMIGPRAQTVLREWLRTDTQAFLFSPNGDGKRPYRRDSYRNAIVRGCELAFEMPFRLRRIATYVAWQKDLNDDQRRKLKQKLQTEACTWRHEHCWAPNQLRHNVGTAARRVGGIEAARVVLGHSSIRTSEIYSERDMAAARAVVAQIG